MKMDTNISAKIGREVEEESDQTEANLSDKDDFDEYKRVWSINTLTVVEECLNANCSVVHLRNKQRPNHPKNIASGL